MDRLARVAALLFSAASLAACAAVTGLDQIRESDCAPDGCDDAASPLDAAAAATDAGQGGSEAGVDGARDEGSSAVDATGGDASVPEGGGNAPDGDGRDAAFEAGIDAGHEAGLDASVDAGVDAAADTGTLADASRAPEAGCGSVFLQDSFAANAAGWALDATWTIAQECASPPAPQKGSPDPTADHTGAAGSGVLGAYVCGNNPTGATTPYRYATSPAMDVSGAATVELAFWRWLNSDAAGWMASTVDVYDGNAWVNVYTNPAAAGDLVADAAWTHQSYDLTAYKNAALRVRFGYSIVSASVYAMSAWNVDDVTVSAGACP